MFKIPFEVIHCHGSENQFILIDEWLLGRKLDDISRRHISQLLCDQEVGFAVDGLLFCNQEDFSTINSTSCHYDSSMRMFNPDGSEAEMCGNGLRCVGRYVLESRPKTLVSERVKIATPKEVLEISRVPNLLPNVCSFKSEIGPLSWSIPTMQIPVSNANNTLVNQPLPALSDYLGADTLYTALSIPNPHLVGVSKTHREPKNILKAWHYISENTWFPEGVNLSVVTPLYQNDETHIFVITCERGVGLTKSCGTAMAASSTVIQNHYSPQNPIKVFNAGGFVICDTRTAEDQNKVLLTGNATWIKRAQVKIDLLARQVDITITQSFSDEQESYAQLKDHAQKTIMKQSSP